MLLHFQELEAIKARVKEMEEEAEKLKEMQSEVEKQMNLSNTSSNTSLSKYFRNLNEIFWSISVRDARISCKLSGQIVAFFTFCICIWSETFLLSVSVSGQQKANRYRYQKT